MAAPIKRNVSKETAVRSHWRSGARRCMYPGGRFIWGFKTGQWFSPFPVSWESQNKGGSHPAGSGPQHEETPQ